MAAIGHDVPQVSVGCDEDGQAYMMHIRPASRTSTRVCRYNRLRRSGRLLDQMLPVNQCVLRILRRKSLS